MGQAKARGTLEQRIAQAQVRDAALREAWEKCEAEAKARKDEAIAKLPPDARKQRSAIVCGRHILAANIVGLLLAMQADETHNT